MCITSVPKTELFGFIYFFVRNPYVYKFWDLIFEENVKQTTTKKIQKAQFWARLEYTCASRVKIATSNSKNRAGNRIFRFGLKPWVQGGVEYIGK